MSISGAPLMLPLVQSAFNSFHTKSDLAKLFPNSICVIALNLQLPVLDRSSSPAGSFQLCQQARQVIGVRVQSPDDGDFSLVLSIFHTNFGGLRARRGKFTRRRRTLAILLQCSAAITSRRDIKFGACEQSCHWNAIVS